MYLRASEKKKMSERVVEEKEWYWYFELVFAGSTVSSDNREQG